MEYKFRGAIRLPTPADAETIAEVHVESWRESYGHLLHERFFDGDAVASRVQMWTRALAMDVPGRQIRVAELDGALVGFALSLPSRDDSPVHEAELAMIYLLKTAQGSGLGQLLLDGVLGDRSAALWMAEDNPRALAFYRRNRFEPTGERRLDENVDNLAEIRMARTSA
ncbi:ribosomal protein S18 acetylase RimI-like enzyme [Nakamurella sp. UYEF19]|uniref:GNAT family N-acetyltransferase n=1 Tax=Nakamurella sp. UYEF19 TaxID=1756392 RepID=UPI00339989E0